MQKILNTHLYIFTGWPYIGRSSPQEISSLVQSSCSIWHSIKGGPSWFFNAYAIALVSSPPVVTRRPSPFPSSVLKAVINQTRI